VPPLRVGLDGRGFGSPAGGVRRYVRELTTALVAIDPGIELVAIGARPGDALPAGVIGVPIGRSLPSNLGWSIDGLPRAIRQTDLDLFHAPAYTAPLWGAHRLVVTIHDVSYARHPEWYPYRIDPLRRWFYRRSAQAADLVITDSEFSRREIEGAYGISPERIRVIPLGVGAPFAPMADKQGTPDQRLPTILHVGDLHARRNLRILVDVLAMLRSREDALRNTSLVLAGADRGAGADILEHAKALGVANGIRFLQAADDQAVVALMHQADVFAYPSVYEGFGLPPLEAMACGTPVIASTASSIPDVVGDAGLLVAPDNIRGWYDAAVSVLTSEPHAAALRRSGLARAASFTWQRTARQTRDVYREVARRHTAA
jgi:glycosyltransferase involved in cell wall biosynthesis